MAKHFHTRKPPESRYRVRRHRRAGAALEVAIFVLGAIAYTAVLLAFWFAVLGEDWLSKPTLSGFPREKYRTWLTESGR